MENPAEDPKVTVQRTVVTSDDPESNSASQTTTVVTTSEVEGGDQNSSSTTTTTKVVKKVIRTVTTSAVEGGIVNGHAEIEPVQPVAEMEEVGEAPQDTAAILGLHKAICADDPEKAEALILAGADVNEKFPEGLDPEHTGLTPLALACALNKVGVVKILLENGADVNSTFASLNTTALMTSCYHGHVDVVKLLIKFGGNVNALDSQQSTALGYAFGGTRNMEVITLLLEAGVNVNQKNMLGMNALLLVAGYGSEELVAKILDAGGDPQSVNDFGHNALYMAVTGKRQLLFGLPKQELMNGSEMHPEMLEREWVRAKKQYPAEMEDSHVLVGKAEATMMNIGNNLKPMSPETLANPQDVIQLRLQALAEHRRKRAIEGPKVKRSNSFLNTLLSCGGGKSKQAKDADKPKPLSKAPGNDPSTQPISEAEMAIINSCARILKRLINAACRVDLPDRAQNITALDLAILHGDVDSAVLLVKAGADPEHLNKLMAATDLYHAITYGDKRKQKDVMADPDLDVNRTFCRFNLVAPDGTIQNEYDIGVTPLTLAARENDAEMVKNLLKRGAMIDFIGPSGRFALAEASARGHKKIVELLVTSNATLDLPCEAYLGATPIAIAANAGHPSVVEYLIFKGAKVDIPMSNQRTALLNSMEANNHEMTEILLKADLQKNVANPEGLHFQLAQMYQSKEKDVGAIMQLGHQALQQNMAYTESEMYQDDYGQDITDTNANMDGKQVEPNNQMAINAEAAQAQQAVAAEQVTMSVDGPSSGAPPPPSNPPPSHDPAGQTSV